MSLSAQQILDETLRWAVNGNDAETAREKIAKGADVTISTNNRSLLCQAVYDARFDKVAFRLRTRDLLRVLLDAGADINAAGPDLQTPLLTALIGNNVEMIAWLLDNGADITQRDKNGYTPLHVAFVNDLSTLDNCRMPLLLARGADPDVSWKNADTEGSTVRQMVQGILKTPTPDIAQWARDMLSHLSPHVSEIRNAALQAKAKDARFKLPMKGPKP